MKINWRRGFQRIGIIFSLGWGIFSILLAIGGMFTFFTYSYDEKPIDLSKAKPEGILAAITTPLSRGAILKRVQHARDMGATDAQIARGIEKSPRFNERIARLRKMGAPDAQIFKRFGLQVSDSDQISPTAKSEGNIYAQFGDEPWKEYAAASSLTSKPKPWELNWEKHLDFNGIKSFAYWLISPILFYWILFFSIAWIIKGFKQRDSATSKT
jgi:hypothetical protein